MDLGQNIVIIVISINSIIIARVEYAPLASALAEKCHDWFFSFVIIASYPPIELIARHNRYIMLSSTVYIIQARLSTL